MSGLGHCHVNRHTRPFHTCPSQSKSDTCRLTPASPPLAGPRTWRPTRHRAVAVQDNALQRPRLPAPRTADLPHSDAPGVAVQRGGGARLQLLGSFLPDPGPEAAGARAPPANGASAAVSSSGARPAGQRQAAAGRTAAVAGACGVF